MTVRIPRVCHGGRWRSRDEIEATAARWRAEIVERLGGAHVLPAGVAPATADAVPLVLALTSLPSPVLLLSRDPAGWNSVPPIPSGTLVALPPAVAHLAPDVERIGAVPCVLSGDADAARTSRSPAFTPLASDGIVLLTSGSTGTPKAVYRRMDALCAGAWARLTTLGVQHGAGVITGGSLAHGHALIRLLSAMLVGGPFALLDPLDHRAALATLARPEFGYWAASAHFADVLGRCTLTGPPVAPRICLLSSPISRAAFDAFLDRFGVPLRQTYSSTETGQVAVDAAPAADVRHGTVGHPLPGVDVHIGEHPDSPAPAGETGRLWIRSPWRMAGYGFPPALSNPDVIDGWWPTRDLGFRDADGRLTLAGRLDDCIRTREGRLVNLAFVADGLRGADGVRAAEVLPIASLSGASFGAVLECAPSVTLAALKTELSGVLPPWAWPRHITLVRSLPRLANGKPDRRSCAALLHDARPS